MTAKFENLDKELIPTEIELLLDLAGEEYVVHILKPEEAIARSKAPLPYKPDELIAILKLLSTQSSVQTSLRAEQKEILLRLGLILEDQPVHNLIETIGCKLFDSLLSGEISSYLRQLLIRLRHPKAPVRILLKFYEQDVILTKYPWKILHDPIRKGHSLLLSGAVNLTRKIQHPSSPFNRLPLKKLDILYIESRSQDVNFDTLPSGIDNQEYQAVKSALQTPGINTRTRFKKLEPPSFHHFREYLSKNQINILHFDGHGTVARVCPKCKRRNYPHQEICQNENCKYSIANVEPLGYLAFRNSDSINATDWINSQELGTLISNHEIDLAVLSACQSGETRGKSIFGSVGPALIQAGIPAVIAMQLPVTHDSAGIFMKAFYNEIMLGHSLSEAVRQGRNALSSRNPEWFVPTIYSQGNIIQTPFFKV